jgi:AhpD family alkylhydroperoxidase
MPRRRADTVTSNEAHPGPGLLKVLKRSPAAHAAYLGLHQGLAHGGLSMRERCLVGVMVAQRNGSSYYLSVQARLAQQAGVTREQIQAAREGSAKSEREVALLFLAGKLVINRGELADADTAAVRQAGLSETEVFEVILHVAFHLSAASISHAARLPLDFPPAPPLPAF